MMAQRKPLEIRLPCCPVEGCEQVSPLPAANWSGKTYCTGGEKHKHTRTKMLPRLFVEKEEK